MVLAGFAGPCVFLFYFLFSFSALLKRGTDKKNCSSPGWMVGGFRFPGVRADFDLEGSLHLLFVAEF